MMDFALDAAVDEISRMINRESLFDIVCANDTRKWDAIRRIYATADFEHYRAYLVDWTKIFSPIESMAWGELRYLGLPFYPQYPIGRFFADFADPIRKLVIECDGKDFHNQIRDAERDAIMAANDWRVFRVSGADCNRILPDPWEDFSCAEDDIERFAAIRAVEKWAYKTVDGLVWALGHVYYGRPVPSSLVDVAYRVVDQRMSKTKGYENGTR